MDINKQIFDTVYPSLMKPATSGYFKKLDEFRQDVLLRFAKNANTLDIGCGSGTFLKYLLQHNIAAIGLDYSKPILDTSNESTISVCGDIRNSPFGTNVFNFIYSISTMYCFSRVDMAIKEINRILSSNGFAYLEFGNINSLNTFEVENFTTGIISYLYDINDIIQILEQNNLYVIENNCFQIFPYHNNQVSIQIRDFMATGTPMLDWQISSSAFFKQFAFRHCLLVSRQKSEIFNNHKTMHFSSTWLDPDKCNQRYQAYYKGNLKELALLLKKDPSDPITVWYIAFMHIYNKNYAQFQFVWDMKKQIVETVKKVSGEIIDNLFPEEMQCRNVLNVS